MRPAVFLDRDGTILVERGGPPTDPGAVELIPGAAEGLRALAKRGFAVVVVTNQSGIARGHFDESTYRAVTERMLALLEAEGARPDAVYHCPHHPSVHGPCSCRKPEAGMIFRAVDELRLDLGRSWCVGDAERDLRAGRAAGCDAILVLTGKGEAERASAEPIAYRVVADLAAAARLILNGDGPEERNA
jgi:D-glycero-D-manno-heptose 1,7-bisphosphate phosphatase